MIGLITSMKGAVVCSVHEPPGHAADPHIRADEMVFLRENFSWLIALFAPFVLLAHGAWLPLAAYLVLTTLIVTALDVMNIPQVWSVIALIAMNVLFAFETPSLQRWTMKLGGWNEVAVVSGADEGECHRRFYDAWLTELAAKDSHDKTATPDPQPAPGGHSALRRLFASGP